MQTIWENSYARRVQWLKSSAIRELLKVTQIPGCISFGGGLPAPEVFPVEEIAAAAQKVLREKGPQSLQYSTTEGYLPLREFIADYVAGGRVSISPDNVLITSGSQQALDMLGKVFLDEGDTVLVDSPTYMGALQAWAAYGARYQVVPTDANGVVVEELKTLLKAGPKWLYAMPNFQNPTGLTLSLQHRQQLVELTNKYGIPLIEDDPYVQLRFEGESLPSLIQLAGQLQAPSASGEQGAQDLQGVRSNVIYLGTFSKILAPGLRLGWIIAPSEVIGKMAQAKQGMDLQSATFNQMLAAEVLRGDFLPRHIQNIRRVYRERRDVMLSAMQQHFPEGVSWTRPEGGMFLWVTMPEGVDTEALLGEALANKVAFVPGTSFHPLAASKNTMRLNFSNAHPDQIKEGIARLGRVFQSARGNST
ncbi:MAG: PLP-dependent aminotransferase family protein [Ktedonobacteraceae bacterium]